MELSKDGKKRQRMRTFSFGTEKSQYTLEEAIKAGIKLRKEKERIYTGL
ncbi:hypothetical protein [Idiomarina abyssalis]|uniref:Uncharacterized protein n=1 Tax=Idiomarina abyssalis TaxID=86102 RepID=A0A8I1GF45_9GAMM|nr:hypothetical protein [Idiomarina abyssalis]MBJ7265438.1 hypothetical protein [Idiomarina abyssalis]MBJ7316888.1 hypothetical protein [Idiomarina abyssalis]